MKLKHLAAFAAAAFFLNGFAVPAQAQGGPSDPQIAGIVVAANQIDIDAGKLAKSHSKNKEVKEFAQRMITDHTAVNKQAGALAKKLKVSYSTLLDLNPELQRGVTPPGKHVIRIPAAMAAKATDATAESAPIINDP